MEKNIYHVKSYFCSVQRQNPRMSQNNNNLKYRKLKKTCIWSPMQKVLERFHILLWQRWNVFSFRRKKVRMFWLEYSCSPWAKKNFSFFLFCKIFMRNIPAWIFASFLVWHIFCAEILLLASSFYFREKQFFFLLFHFNIPRVILFMTYISYYLLIIFVHFPSFFFATFCFHIFR